MDWNADLHENKYEFVVEYGKSLLAHVPKIPGQFIPAQGCGTGTLTRALQDQSASVTGVDSSPAMIAKDRERYPGVDVRVLDGCRLPWSNRFDVVFSNAVFHWIPYQEPLLDNMFRVLKLQERLI